MKIYNNIPLLITKKDIPEIEKQLKEQIKETIKEFNMYYNTKEEIKIEYEFMENLKGFNCEGYLYFGDKLIKKYSYIDLLFYDINEMILNRLLPTK